MISRINSCNNPHFFILVHHCQVIQHFFLIPNFYFIPHYIEKRRPLSATARRTGWVGCNINLSNIPQNGFIFIIKDAKQISKDLVLKQVASASRINNKSLEVRGWLLDVLKCIEQISQKEFSLHDVYLYADHLKELHLENYNIKAKIRQQLQILRDKGFIDFLGYGRYRKKE